MKKSKRKITAEKVKKFKRRTSTRSFKRLDRSMRNATINILGLSKELLGKNNLCH